MNITSSPSDFRSRSWPEGPVPAPRLQCRQERCRARSATEPGSPYAFDVMKRAAPIWPHFASLSAAMASTPGSGDIRRRLPIRSRRLAHLQVGTRSARVAHAACPLEQVQVRTAAGPGEGS
jgi:hypothetical protein